jgi:hypothetical protein
MFHMSNFSRPAIRLIGMMLIAALLGFPSMVESATQATSPTLGAAANFSILAETEITNVPSSHIGGDVGLEPGPGSQIGLTDLEVDGTIYARDGTAPVAANATVDPTLLGNARNAVMTVFTGGIGTGIDQQCTTTYAGVQDLTLVSPLIPGVYCADAFILTGNLTLTGSTGVWIFKSAATLTTSADSSVTGGDPCNVWWRLVSAADLFARSSIVGNILAGTSINMRTNAVLNGRALAQAAVTLDQNTINVPICARNIPVVSTEIHDVDHVELTYAARHTIVHDMATVTSTIGIPTGVVSFTVFHNQDCTGIGEFAGAVPLDDTGVADPSDPATVTRAGLSYLAYYLGDEDNEAAYGPCETLLAVPTAVELLYFRAEPLNGQSVRLEWATEVEVDNFGFNLYRANKYDLQAASLIHFEPAVSDGASGATYVFLDTTSESGLWWYWLADLDTQGRETFHQPVSTFVPSNSGSSNLFYLPTIWYGSGF